jgi:hypothetical protein
MNKHLLTLSFATLFLAGCEAYDPVSTFEAIETQSLNQYGGGSNTPYRTFGPQASPPVYSPSPYGGGLPPMTGYMNQ